MSLRGNIHVWLGCIKTRSPKFGTVLYWQPPDGHIFGNDCPYLSASFPRFTCQYTQKLSNVQNFRLSVFLEALSIDNTVCSVTGG